MLDLPGPLQFLLAAVAAWMNQRQTRVIDYLREENRVLREQLGDKTRPLAAKAKGLGRPLDEVGPIVTPAALQVWPCKLIAQKFGGTANLGAGRPRKSSKIETLSFACRRRIGTGGIGASMVHCLTWGTR